MLSYHPAWKAYLIALGKVGGEGTAWAGLAIILVRTYLPMLAPKLAAQAAPIMAMMSTDGEASDPPPVH